MKVICIGGHAQHGKDSFAGFLKKHLEVLGNDVLTIHYADQLKYICREYFDWNGEKDQVGRTLLQRIGTGFARKRDPEIWIKYVAMFLRVFGEIYDYVIIPDCRFSNEIDWVYGEYDCLTVHIDRPDFDNGLTEDQKNHPSETALDDYPFNINVTNDGTLNDLDDVADVMAQMINLLAGPWEIGKAFSVAGNIAEKGDVMARLTACETVSGGDIEVSTQDGHTLRP